VRLDYLKTGKDQVGYQINVAKLGMLATLIFGLFATMIFHLSASAATKTFCYFYVKAVHACSAGEIRSEAPQNFLDWQAVSIQNGAFRTSRFYQGASVAFQLPVRVKSF